MQNMEEKNGATVVQVRLPDPSDASVRLEHLWLDRESLKINKTGKMTYLLVYVYLTNRGEKSSLCKGVLCDVSAGVEKK